MVVGVGTATQRDDDPTVSVEALTLMVRAARAAADDAGAPGLLDQLDWVGVPEGTWAYRDPGRLVASALGRPDPASVTTVLADVGILQQDLITAAVQAVTDGARVALVVGGEAKHRERRAALAGVEVVDTDDGPDAAPDVRVRPDSLGVSDLEIIRNTVTPVAAYALIENAIAHDRHRTPDQHRADVAALWARLAAVARDNPDAWDRNGWDAAAIADPDAPGNRMISFPYTRRHSAQWNVDQAAAVLVTTAATARELEVAAARWVHPLAAVVSNHAVPVSERAEIGRCVGAEVAGPRALELAGVTAGDLGPVDLYSCFPSAVELLAAALGLPLDDPARPLSVTGGLTFAGGPLNNYVIGALVELVRCLRAEPGAVGLSSSVSGFLVKQGFGLWSTTPAPGGFRAEDVSDEVAVRTVTVPVVPDGGDGVVATFTVDGALGAPDRTVAIVDLAGGRRTIATSTDPDLGRSFVAADPIGTPVRVDDAGTLSRP